MSPLGYVASAARAALGNENCWPAVARNSDLPAVVYYGIGEDVVGSLDHGPHVAATVIRLDMRADTYTAAVELDGALLKELRAAGRLASLGTLVDDYDEDLEIYRRIRSVTVIGG